LSDEILDEYKDGSGSIERFVRALVNVRNGDADSGSKEDEDEEGAEEVAAHGFESSPLFSEMMSPLLTRRFLKTSVSILDFDDPKIEVKVV